MSIRRLGLLAGLVLAAAPVAPVQAGVGDLLVAPTRIILDGRKGAEIILNNIGDDVATYRVSLELKRMKPDGTLETVKDANDKDLLGTVFFNGAVTGIEQADGQTYIKIGPRKVVLSAITEVTG